MTTPDPARRFAPNFLLELFNNPLDPGYADAARRRAADGPRSPWRRRAALGLRTVVLVATGFLLAVAYREAVASRPAATSAHAGLVNEVKAAQGRTDDLQARSDDLRHQVDLARQSLLGGGSDELRRIQQQEAATGLAAVTGAGAVVALTDAAPPENAPATAQVNRVLDVDLQGVVNGLWAAGAEAISVNGQRLTATSTIRTAGTAILVDFRPLQSPYEVSAIGPDDLADRYTRSTSAAAMRGLVQQYGLGFAIRTADDLRLPASTGPSLRYAHTPGAPPPSPSGGPK